MKYHHRLINLPLLFREKTQVADGDKNGRIDKYEVLRGVNLWLAFLKVSEKGPMRRVVKALLNLIDSRWGGGDGVFSKNFFGIHFILIVTERLLSQG